MDYLIKIILRFILILSFGFTHLHAADKMNLNVVVGRYYTQYGISYPLLALSHAPGTNWHYPKQIAAECQVSTLGPRVSCHDDYCILVKDCNDKLLIATSVDQGNSWTDREITPFKAKNYYVKPSCNNQFCVLAGGYQDEAKKEKILIAVSQDKGTSWTYPAVLNLPKDFENPSIRAITCTDESCVAIGNYHYRFPFVITSIDQGLTWSFVSVPPVSKSTQLTQVYCEAKNCIATGHSSGALVNQTYFIKSSDAGMSWSRSTALFVMPYELKKSTCHGNLCATVGYNYLLSARTLVKQVPFVGISLDKGASWFAPLIPLLHDFASFNDVSCVGKRCIVVGSTTHEYDQPIVAISRDSGFTWTYQRDFPPPTNQPALSHSYFNYVHCKEDFCVIGGNYGLNQNQSLPWLIVSQNGGENWTAPSTVLSELPADFRWGKFFGGSRK